MRVVFFSTYPPIECGIGAYTQWLTQALRDAGPVEIFVISHAGAVGPGIIPILRPSEPGWVEEALDNVSGLRPDVVHIQHEFDLYGARSGMAVLDLARGLRRLGLPVVTTLHTVRAGLDPLRQGILRTLVETSSRVLVHEAAHGALLGATPELAGKIEVIDHGVRLVERVPDAKAKLGLGDSRVVLSCGYLRPAKGFHLLVELFPGIGDRVPDAVLVIASGVSSFSPVPRFVSYRRELLDQIGRSPCARRIWFMEGPFPQEQFDTLFSAADVVVLPYETVTQSGILAHCYAFERPVVVSDLPAFRAAIARSGGGFTARTADEYIHAAVKLLEDTELHHGCQEAMRRYVLQEASWPRVAARHLRIYSTLLEGRA